MKRPVKIWTGEEDAVIIQSLNLPMKEVKKVPGIIDIIAKRGPDAFSTHFYKIKKQNSEKSLAAPTKRKYTRRNHSNAAPIGNKQKFQLNVCPNCECPLAPLYAGIMLANGQ